MREGLEARGFLSHDLNHRERSLSHMQHAVTRDRTRSLEPVDMRGPGNPGVVGELIAYVQDDQDGRSEADREARDVDEAVELVSQESPHCSRQIVAQHGSPAPSLLRQKLRAVPVGLLPAATERDVEMHRRLETGEPRLGKRISRAEEGLLRLQYVEEVGDTLAILEL